jgi:hypothetical protein
MELNSLMSIAEAGVVFGVILQGTEYVPPIHRRWPALEKVGFLVLVLALVADWHFQSAINERQTQDLITANNRIAMLARRYQRLWLDQDKRVAALKPFAKQKVAILACSSDPWNTEIPALALEIAGILDNSNWLNPWGEPILVRNGPGSGGLFNKIEFPASDGRCTQGLFVEVPPTAPREVRKAATVLAEQVTGWDIDRLNWPWPSFLPAKNDIILVTVGIKGS